VSRGRILVVRGGAIGDFILTLPALAALRKNFPETHLEVLGYTSIAGLARLAGYVAEVKSIEAGPLAGFFARNGTLDETLSDYFASFNIIVSYLYDPDSIFQENVGRCSKAQFIQGPYRPSDAGSDHATNVFLSALERLAVIEEDPVPRIRIEGVANRGALAVHPGSGSEKKNWPEESWATFLSRVARETQWPVLIVGGEAEHERVQRLSTIIPVDRLRVALSRSLVEVARELATCRAFVGHDSGISHLAAAVGLRGVALWAESNPVVWRPRSDLFELVPGLPAIEPESVLARVTRLMAETKS
jgi:heptosyltransferase III